MNERPAVALSGWVVAAVWLVLAAGTAWLYVEAQVQVQVPLLVTIVWALLLALVLTGFAMVQPNQSKVVTLFGRYIGTVRRVGWIWTWPLTAKRTISLRVQNFESSVIKVNDAAGNPVEIAAVIVWRVVDTARAVFNVEKYDDFVRLQTETAVRHVASLFPYDSYETEQRSLRANADDVMRSLHDELQGHLETAGVEVVRTQLRRLAYAPEIAADMLRRQQAEAVVAARTRIVAGAVGMVQLALNQLSEQRIVDLDEERKAAMVSNLLVVLCGEQRAQPVVNTGTLYQ
jgi:regulator of protease activity HflC (stomatin/prohibitin superfamily)